MDELSRLHDDLAALRDELLRQGMLSAVLDQRLKAVEADVARIAAHGDTHYVPIARYAPVERVLYGMVGLILASFVAALIALVVRTP